MEVGLGLGAAAAVVAGAEKGERRSSVPFAAGGDPDPVGRVEDLAGGNVRLERTWRG